MADISRDWSDRKAITVHPLKIKEYVIHTCFFRRYKFHCEVKLVIRLHILVLSVLFPAAFFISVK